MSLERFASVCTLVLALILTPALAQEPAPVVLRVNSYYVIYTPPVSPYLDHSGKVLVSLTGFAQLLEGSFDYPAAVVRHHENGRASLVYAGTTLEFDPKKAAIRVVNQGQSVPLPAPPEVLPGGELAVPLQPLAEALGIDFSWDPERKLVWLKDPRLLWFASVNENDYKSVIPPETQDLVPIAYRIKRVGSDVSGWRVELWVKDYSQNGISEEKEAILINYHLGGVIRYSGKKHHWYSPAEPCPVFGPPPPPTCRRSQGGFYCRNTWYEVKTNVIGGPEYILALMRLAP